MEKKFSFQGVGMLFDGGFVRPWGKDEKRENRFVFIGKNLNKDQILKSFKDCQCSADLRFKEGDKVQAFTGQWKDGIVLKCWDDGQPYRIELQNLTRTNIWAPEDTSVYVRARPVETN